MTGSPNYAEQQQYAELREVEWLHKENSHPGINIIHAELLSLIDCPQEERDSP